MYIERLSFDGLRLVTNAMPVIRPLILLNFLCFKKKKKRTCLSQAVINCWPGPRLNGKFTRQCLHFLKMPVFLGHGRVYRCKFSVNWCLLGSIFGEEATPITNLILHQSLYPTPPRAQNVPQEPCTNGNIVNKMNWQDKAAQLDHEAVQTWWHNKVAHTGSGRVWLP